MAGRVIASNRPSGLPAPGHPSLWLISDEARAMLTARALRMMLMCVVFGLPALLGYAVHLNFNGKSIVGEYTGLLAIAIVTLLAVCALLIRMGLVRTGVILANLGSLAAAIAILPVSLLFLPAAVFGFANSLPFTLLYLPRKSAAPFLIIETCVLLTMPVISLVLNPLNAAGRTGGDYTVAAILLTAVTVTIFCYGAIDMYQWLGRTLAHYHELVVSMRKSAERMDRVRASLEMQVADSVAELRDERDFARQIMTTMNEALCVVRMSDRSLEYVNPAMAQLHKRAPDEMRGQPVHRFLSGEMQQLLFDSSPDAITAQTLRLEPRPGDAPRFVQASVTPVRDRHTGEHKRKLVVLTDISAQLRAQEVLREQKVQLEALHATSLDLVTRLDVRDLLQSVLKRACDLLGTEHGILDLVSQDGMHLQSYLQSGAMVGSAARQRPVTEGLAGAAATTLKTQTISDYSAFAGKLVARSGPEIYACVAAPLISHGRALGVLGIAHTEPHRVITSAEVALVDRLAKLAAIALENARLYAQIQDERDFARTIMENIGQPVVVSNPDGHVEYLNDVFTLTFGYTFEDMHGRGAWRYFDGPDRARLYERMCAGAPFSLEVAVRAKPGHYVPFLFSMAPRIPGNARSGHIGVFTDLTAIKHTEQALRDARDKAQAASRLKSQFLATLSHEIRTPLNAIMGMTELVMDTPLDGEQRDMLGVAHESSESLMRMINDMLDFSRIEAGKLNLHEAPLDLNEVIGHTCAMFHKRGEERGLLMRCDVERDVPVRFMGDAVRLRQVLVNLLGNAFKFTQSGSVSLRVSRATSANGVEQLRFEVSDTGIGMKPEVLANLFQPFQQGDASSTRQYGGTGLGLSICKALVEMMGGNIAAFSAPGAGSTFLFTIALKPIPSPNPVPS